GANGSRRGISSSRSKECPGSPSVRVSPTRERETLRGEPSPVGRTEVALRDETRVIREIAGDGPPADSGTGRLFIDAPDTHSAAELVDQLATARPSLMREGTHCRVCVDLDLGDERQ